MCALVHPVLPVTRRHFFHIRMALDEGGKEGAPPRHSVLSIGREPEPRWVVVTLPKLLLQPSLCWTSYVPGTCPGSPLSLVWVVSGVP